MGILAARVLSVACFILVYAMILYVGHRTDFGEKSGIVSVLSGVLLAAFFAGTIWTRIMRILMSVEEKLKLTVVCVVLAILMDFIRITLLSTTQKALGFIPFLILGHIAVGGFIILGALHSANKAFLPGSAIR